MSTSSYRFEDDTPKEPVKWPRRVEILQEEYLKAGKAAGKNVRLEYEIQTEDLIEQSFEKRVAAKPDSLRVIISAVYRVRDSKKNEFYFYNASKLVFNSLNNPEAFSHQGYGFHRRPIVAMQYDESLGRREPKVTGYEHGFELKWDKKEVKKLLDSSTVPCQLFYVGPVGVNSSDPISTDRYYQIHNVEDFLEGSYDELWDMGRLGISYKEQASLYMVESARKKEKENREAALGMKGQPNKVYS